MQLLDLEVEWNVDGHLTWMTSNGTFRHFDILPANVTRPMRLGVQQIWTQVGYTVFRMLMSRVKWYLFYIILLIINSHKFR